MRDVFVGVIFVIGFFLFAYRGYEGDEDNLVGNLSGLFAVGVALFPTASLNSDSGFGRVIDTLHLIFAALFFFTLIYFCLVLFIKTGGNQKLTSNKKTRNRIYRICGYAMSVCILLIIIFKLLPDGAAVPIARFSPVFWLETIALLAFGFSWFIKGETLLKD